MTKDSDNKKNREPIAVPPEILEDISTNQKILLNNVEIIKNKTSHIDTHIIEFFKGFEERYKETAKQGTEIKVLKRRADEHENAIDVLQKAISRHRNILWVVATVLSLFIFPVLDYVISKWGV